MKFTLDFQSEVDILTQGELDASLSRHGDALARQLVRGVRWRRLPQLIGQPADGAVVMGMQDTTSGPASGFAWSVRRLAVAGLTGGDTPDVIAFYRSGTSNPPLWQVDGNMPFAKFGKLEVTLTDDDTLVAASVGTLAATGQIILSGELVEVPGEMLGKLAI